MLHSFLRIYKRWRVPKLAGYYHGVITDMTELGVVLVIVFQRKEGTLVNKEYAALGSSFKNSLQDIKSRTYVISRRLQKKRKQLNQLGC
jgi:hypothetical protein